MCIFESTIHMLSLAITWIMILKIVYQSNGAAFHYNNHVFQIILYRLSIY